MALTTPAELAKALGVGTLYDEDTILQEVCDAADNVLLPFIWANKFYNVAHSSTTTVGTLYFDEVINDIFYVGQTVVITGNGAKHNGSKTITEVGEYSISYAINNGTVSPRHPVNPLGTVAAETYFDPSTVPSIQMAALLIAEAIWQARQAPSGQGMSVDGFTPSPFTMSNTLLARVRGLIAPYLSPSSMIG